MASFNSFTVVSYSKMSNVQVGQIKLMMTKSIIGSDRHVTVREIEEIKNTKINN